MIFNYISLPVFIISFSIGLFIAYIMGTEMKTIYIYPSPELTNNILFKDNADNCFSLSQKEVKCPSDESQIFKVPIQE
jgi:hypothetical protein